MKFSNSFLAVISLIVVSQAYVVELFDDKDCQTSVGSRNVYDNSCATTQGFRSFKITTYGGGLQQLTAYEQNACAGVTTQQGCAQGINKMQLDTCYGAFNPSSGSNALSSYSEGGPCPN